MARLVLSKHDEVEYIPEDFRKRPAAEQPKFVIGVLTGRQRQQVNLLRSKAVQRDGDGKVTGYDTQASNEALIRSCELGLRGWSGVEDQDGEAVTWPGSGAKAVLLLPQDIVVELGAAVINRSELSEEQRGN